VHAALEEAFRDLRQAYGPEHGHVNAVLDSLSDKGEHAIRQIPWAAQSVLNLLRRRGYGLNELKALLEKDPALSQSLPRHANSAYYAVRGDAMVSIKRAIQRVGTEGVHGVVMFQALQGQLSRPGGRLDNMVKMTWKHMVRVAPLCRDLAADFGVDPERAFTLGLLHDVGKLVLFDHVADLRHEVRRDLNLPMGFVHYALSALHEPLGALALLAWGMDSDSARVIAHPHTPSLDPAHDPMTEVVHIAERLDLAAEHHEDVDLEALWECSELGGPKEKVRAYLEGSSQAA